MVDVPAHRLQFPDICFCVASVNDKNIPVYRHFTEVCPILLYGKLLHLLVDQPLFFFRNVKLHLYISLSVFHFRTAFRYKGLGLSQQALFANGYSFAVLAIYSLSRFKGSVCCTLFLIWRKKRLQPLCAAISCFPYCEVSPLLVRLLLSPLPLRLQSVCLYRSYRPAARQAAAARWISPHCCSGRKIDLPKYDTGLQGHRIPVNSAVVPCSRYSQGSAGKYITRRLPFCGSRRIHFSRLL